jgi:hypothetical protein
MSPKIVLISFSNTKLFPSPGVPRMAMLVPGLSPGWGDDVHEEF